MRFAFFILLLGFISCEEGEVIVIENDDVEMDGKKLYQRHCYDCHGEDGTLGFGGAFDLTTSNFTREERIEIITNGSENGKMRPFALEQHGDLTTAQIESVADYIETLISE